MGIARRTDLTNAIASDSAYTLFREFLPKILRVGLGDFAGIGPEPADQLHQTSFVNGRSGPKDSG